MGRGEGAWAGGRGRSSEGLHFLCVLLSCVTVLRLRGRGGCPSPPGGGDDASHNCRLKRATPIGLSPLTLVLRWWYPLASHHPMPLLCWYSLYLPHCPPDGCADGALSHDSVSGPHGGVRGRIP